jgi:aldehyde:ferredoxin oxidoreductase
MQANGYMGKVLWVDLNKSELKVGPIPEDDLKQFIGGRGMGIKLLNDLAPEGVDTLAPENPMIFATGPYTGTGVFSAFFNVIAKGPMIGKY